MTRQHTPTDGGSDQSDEYSGRFETIEAKAKEALRHDDPIMDCNISVSAHNRDYDSDRNVANHLIRAGEEWIAVRTWSEPSDEARLTVTDYGETLETEVLELAEDHVAERIANGALDAIDSHETVGRPVKPFTTLVRYAPDVADDLITAWETAADRVVRERLYQGLAGWTGRTAWTAYEEEGFYFQAEQAATQFVDEHVRKDVNEDVQTTIRNICREALYVVIVQHRDPQTPNMQYAAEVTLTD
ncbi:hypothetical protein [Halorubrum kocurii]|uniref:hypothetical protein n=1 Tax=Halorubrum kocurii TaxID=478441 RepID=UPI00126800E9|nr:hypothetical protein [Halorubrum kocurii]